MKQIKCSCCKKLKKHHAKGLCNSCYKVLLLDSKPELRLKKNIRDREYYQTLSFEQRKEKEDRRWNNLREDLLMTKRIYNKFNVYLNRHIVKENQQKLTSIQNEFKIKGV